MPARTPPRPENPLRALSRVVAAWLVLVLVLQGLATVHALVQGPAHRHTEATLARLDAAHAHAHEHGIAHHHEHPHEQALPMGASVGELETAALMLLALCLPLAAPLLRPAGAPWRAAFAGPGPLPLRSRSEAPPQPPPRH